MPQTQISLVMGPAGVGKTFWIRGQIAKSSDPVIYFAAGAGSLPIDGVHLGVEFPQVKVLMEGQEAELLAQIELGIPVFVEVSFHHSPFELQQIFSDFDCTWIGFTTFDDEDCAASLWADEMIEGQPVKSFIPHPHVWRAPLVGQVLDPASLEVFWEELTQGAYGDVYRVKGIFEMPEGQSIFGEYTAGFKYTNLDDFVILNLPRHLDDRPNRFSGLEVVGKDLDTVSLGHSLRDSCLSEAAILDYQSQVKEAIAQGELAA